MSVYELLKVRLPKPPEPAETYAIDLSASRHANKRFGMDVDPSGASTLSKSGSNAGVGSGTLSKLVCCGESDCIDFDCPVRDLFEKAPAPEYKLAFDIFITSLVVRLTFSAEPSLDFFSDHAGAVVENA